MLEVRKQGVRVLAVCSGSVDTPMIREQNTLTPTLENILRPEDVAQTILDAIRMTTRAMVSEIDIRPANP